MVEKKGGFRLETTDVIVSTTEGIPGQEIEKVKDIVSGNLVVPNSGGMHLSEKEEKLVKDIDYDRNTAGVINELRKQAMNRMIKAAEEIDADAIIGVDFKTSRVPGSDSGGDDTSVVKMEILAYGTAVKLK